MVAGAGFSNHAAWRLVAYEPKWERATFKGRKHFSQIRPWLAVLDGDDAGQQYILTITARDFDPAFVAQRCRTHPAGHLEDQLLADGLPSGRLA